MVTYRPKDFPIAELVPQATLASLGEGACWNLFDENALRALQALRDLVGPCEVNTWVRGGPHQFRGWRPRDCPVGAAKSAHKDGRAFDVMPLRMSADAARQKLRENASVGDLALIRRIEIGVSWVHFDTRLTEFKP